MRRRTPFSSCLVAGLAVSLVACGGDPTGTTAGDELTDAEVQALFTELSASFAAAGLAAPAMSRVATPGLNLSSAAVIPINSQFNQSVSCTGGGQVSLVGSLDGEIDDQTFLGGFNVDMAWDFAACVVPAGAITFTVEGAPDIQFTGDFTIGATEFSVSGTETGGFSFVTSDDRAGSCAINVTFDVSVNSETQAVTESVSGEVCGRSASSFTTFQVG